MGNENENIGQLCQEQAKIPTRRNCECLAELGYELSELDYKLHKLKNAIAADPASVNESQKALLAAMKAYKKALQARIIDLIDNDKDNDKD